jgi:hypothetical protein
VISLSVSALTIRLFVGRGGARGMRAFQALIQYVELLMTTLTRNR